jgi:hypothetical protein
MVLKGRPPLCFFLTRAEATFTFHAEDCKDMIANRNDIIPRAPTPPVACKALPREELVTVARSECKMGGPRVGFEIAAGVILTIATVLLFFPIAMVIAIAQGLGKGDKNWIFVLAFLRNDVIRVKELEEKEKVDLLARIDGNVNVVNLKNYRVPPISKSYPNMNAKSQEEEYENLKDAIKDTAPFQHCDGKKAKKYAKNLLVDLKYASSKVGDEALNNFFSSVTDDNLNAQNFFQKLTGAISNLGSFQLVRDIGRENFFLVDGKEKVDLNAPVNLEDVTSTGQEAQKMQFFHNICCKIYRKFQTDKERILCLKTLLNMPYAQGPSTLVMTGIRAEISERYIAGELENDHIIILNFIPDNMRRVTVFHLNDDCSITVEGSAFCAPNADEFARKTNDAISNSSHKHTPNGPPFAYSQIRYTCDCKGGATINEAECAYRY